MTGFRNILFITGLIISLIFTSCKPNPKEILIKSFDKCQSINNGYYEMSHFKKYMYGDTVNQSYNCYFEKLPDDTIFSSAFHFQQYNNGKYSQDVLYTENEFVTYWIYDSVGEIMSKELWAKDIKSRGHKYSYYSPIINRQSYPLPTESDFMDNKKYFQFIGEVIINESPCFHVSMSHFPEYDSTEVLKTIKIENQYWIHKTKLIPIKYTIKYTLEEYGDTLYQYEENILDKFELNSHKKDSNLALSSVPSYVNLKDFIPYKSPELLSNNTFAPNWTLFSLKGENISLSNLKGNLVLIDFFYKSCNPCMLALPGLQNLHEKYKEKGLRIIGIDPIDTKEKDDIENYLSKRGVTYPILLSDRNVAKEYHVYGYPTIYLIDKNGKIILSTVGYKEGKENELEEIILKYL